MLGASLHSVLTRVKSQPDVFPGIDIIYSPQRPLSERIILNLKSNGLRLQFDGPEQRLRLIEVLDFTKTQLTYNGTDLVKVSETKDRFTLHTSPSSPTGPGFRQVNRLFGPAFPGKYTPPSSGSGSRTGLYILSYPGIAFTFPLNDSAWPPAVDHVSLLSSSNASPAKALVIFNGDSWPEIQEDFLTRPCPNPRSLTISPRGKEPQPSEIDLAIIRDSGVIDMIRGSSPFQIVLNETTVQDLVAELGPPDAVYRKNDRRLSIHKRRTRERTRDHRAHSGSPSSFDDMTDTDQSSTQGTTDASDIEDDNESLDEITGDLSAECFYNYFHHGFDIFISYPTASFGEESDEDVEGSSCMMSTERLVATKILLHANVPGSYPFNRYRRCQWVLETGTLMDLNSETPFTELSRSLQDALHDDYGTEDHSTVSQRGMVLNRGWGDSPGSSCELLGGWEESTESPRKGSGHLTAASPGFGNTKLFGFPGLIFEVLKNDAVSCLLVY